MTAEGNRAEQHPSAQWRDAVRQLWTEFDRLRREHAARCREQGRKPPIQREIAEAVGVAPTTLNHWLVHRDTVPEWIVFAGMVKSVGADPGPWLPRWTAAFAAYERIQDLRGTRPRAEPAPATGAPADPPAAPEPAAPDPAAAPVSPESRPRRWRRRTVVLLVAVGLLAVAGAVTVAVWPARPKAPKAPKVWYTTITNTWSETEKKYRGTLGYTNPRTSTRTGKGYPEGATVAIVCQTRNGRPVTDPTTGTSSSVWDKLDDGGWISDLYTTLPKSDGDTPPLGIPVCAD